MKRLVLLVLFLLIAPVSFFCGVYYSEVLKDRRFDYTIAKEQSKIRELRSQIFGSNMFHHAENSPAVAKKLADFDPRSEECFLRLSYLGGFRDIRESTLELSGDGTLRSIVDGDSRQLVVLGGMQTKEIFTRAVSGGLMNYSDAALELKRELAYPAFSYSATDGAMTRIVIQIPQLGANQTINVDRPDMEIKNYPDIIEYRLILDFQKELLSLVPPGDPIWK